MKIISIISSFRKNGNTEKMVKLIEHDLFQTAKIENAPLEVETLLIGHMNIQFCHGCRVCFDKGEQLCPLKDAIFTIREKIQQADGIILASPVYVEDINGIMKNWIDRMAYNCHRPAYSGKAAIILSTSGANSSSRALRTMNNALHTWGFHVCAKEKFSADSNMDIENMKSLYKKRIKKMADCLFFAIKNNQSEKPSFYSLLTFKVQQKYWQRAVKKQPSLDFNYWKSHGWLEKSCEYYTFQHCSRIKVKLARFAGGIVAKFFM